MFVYHLSLLSLLALSLSNAVAIPTALRRSEISELLGRDDSAAQEWDLSTSDLMEDTDPFVLDPNVARFKPATGNIEPENDDDGAAVVKRGPVTPDWDVSAHVMEDADPFVPEPNAARFQGPNKTEPGDDGEDAE